MIRQRDHIIFCLSFLAMIVELVTERKRRKMERLNRHYIYISNRNSPIEFIRLAILTVVTFFVVYNITIPGLPRQLTSTRLGIIFLLAWVVIRSGMRIQIVKTVCTRQYTQLIIALVGFTLVGMVAVIINGGGDGLRFSDNAIEFVVFWTLCAYAMTKLYGSLDEFFGVLLVITLAQSLFIFLGVLFPTFRLFINSTFNSLSYWNTVRNAEEMYRIGYAYGIGCMTSIGALQMSLGALSVLYFLLRKREHKAMYLFLFVFMTIASTMVARSGLLFNGIVFVFYIIHNSTPKKFLKMLPYLLIMVLLLVWIISASPWSETIMSRMNRLIQLQTNGLYNSYFTVFDNPDTHIPPLVDNLIIGTGFTSGSTNSGYRVNVDGGYLRMYSALGLVGAIILYVTIICKTFKCVKLFRGSSLFSIGVCSICLLLVGEAKEPHILGYMLSLLFVFYYLAEMEINSEKQKVLV